MLIGLPIPLILLFGVLVNRIFIILKFVNARNCDDYLIILILFFYLRFLNLILIAFIILFICTHFLVIIVFIII